MMMEYDLKIVGGTIIDGMGGPARPGDVAIKAGKLAAIGSAPGRAREEIDARDRIVAPGFVDIHTHYDAQLLWDRMLTISPWHGVTTVVMGNCGFGIAPTRPEYRGLIMRTLEKVEGMSLAALEEGLGYDWPFETFAQYLDAVERQGIAINAGALIGHTPVRLYVMGKEATERPATEAEIGQMREIVRGAIKAGALGFATSKAATHVGYEGKPVPSRAASVAEIKSLAAVLGETGQGLMQATVGRELFFDEFRDIARATGRPVTWTALLADMMGPGSHKALLQRSREIAEEGLPVIPQVTCRPLNFEFTFKEPFIFESMPMFKPVSAADIEGKIRFYSDPDFRRAFRESLNAIRPGEIFDGGLAGRWKQTWISHSPAARELEEQNLADAAAKRGIDPIDLALALSVDSRLEARFRMAIFNHDEIAVEELLNAPETVLGLSDAGAHASQLCDACFSTYLLGRWVREKKAISLERAVWMLTARPAQVFGITDRGRLETGLAADLTIFDAATVGASQLRRVHDMPGGQDRLIADASGIEAVIVNGTVIRRNGEELVRPDGDLPGRILRNGRAG
jgi:N-acyl-D-aspartate/D-glutamate deacylase